MLSNEQVQLSRRYIAYKTLINLWFMGAVWLYFYRLFINDQQVGILDGLAFAIGIIAEVPSGALADRFGRDRLVRLGLVLAGLGLLIQAAGSSFLPFFLGQSMMMVGIAFISGADEALFYDRLGFDPNSTHWRKLVTRGWQVALMGILVANVTGGWLHTVNPRIPWILTGLAFMAATALIWTINDPRTRHARRKLSDELATYFSDIKLGFAQFSQPKLRLYVPIIITVQGLFYATGYGLLRLVFLDRFHFDPLQGSLVLASSSLITIGALTLMHRNAERISERRAIVLLALSAAASLLLATAEIGWWGYVVILTLYLGDYILHPFMSEVLNRQAPEQQRATVLSVGSFLKTLPYVVLAPLIGWLNNVDSLEYFLIFWAILILASTVLYLSTKRQDAKVAI